MPMRLPAVAHKRVVIIHVYMVWPFRPTCHISKGHRARIGGSQHLNQRTDRWEALTSCVGMLTCSASCSSYCAALKLRHRTHATFEVDTHAIFQVQALVRYSKLQFNVLVHAYHSEGKINRQRPWILVHNSLGPLKLNLSYKCSFESHVQVYLACDSAAGRPVCSDIDKNNHQPLQVNLQF